jgi:hypothetical protein
MSATHNGSTSRPGVLVPLERIAAAAIEDTVEVEVVHVWVRIAGFEGGVVEPFADTGGDVHGHTEDLSEFRSQTGKPAP